ncbi:alpha-hydroxy acid oxidase [Caballeronia sp. INDeC2]|uniref:alpha-hydroxy acid oxidase n=1 Tax=Caballeronia sp. INDeC2 TaxID=2921747 RepID=UPI00202979C9|nr:alpha-hydroxy acid oxidase [Caballeronia sp. INDeC2]
MKSHLSISDFEASGRWRLPKGWFEYIARGTEGEHNLRAMYSRLESLCLRQRILRDVSKTSLSTSVLGHDLSLPVIVAPTAVAGLMWHDGEVQLGRAARDAGIPFCVSTQSMTSIEDIAERAAGADLWFQLYIFEDRKLTKGILERAKSGGVDSIALTADTPRSPKKE